MICSVNLPPSLPWTVAFAGALRFAGGPVPDWGLVLGRGAFLIRTVRLGGLLKRPVRRNAADAREGEDVHLYRDSSAARMLDLRRRLKAIMDILEGMNLVDLWVIFIVGFRISSIG